MTFAPAGVDRPRPVGILPPVRTLVARIAEPIAPSRLGRNFRWLLSATVVNNVGDGIALAAGPLLVASLTRDPFLVSLALLSEYLPVLLFGVIGGVAADRFDRRRMVIVVDLVRAGVLVVLVATIVSGRVSIVVVLATLFVLGTAETFADSASSTLLPGLVAREDLGIANARMQGAFLLTNQLWRRPSARSCSPPVWPCRSRRMPPALRWARCSISRVVTDHAERAARTERVARRHGRGRPMARRASSDADPGAHDLHVQRHVRRRLVGARPVCRRTARAWTRSDSGCSRPRRPSAA